MRKFYVYSDETGQDTRGVFFLVASVVVSDGRDDLLRWLENVEVKSRKGAAAWRSTEFARRLDYLDRVLSDGRFNSAVYYSTYRSTQDYRGSTLTAISRALDLKMPDRGAYQADVIIDGLQKNELRRAAVDLRHNGIPVHKVRGSRGEANALTRLADAMAGFARDAIEKVPELEGRLHRFGSVIREA